MNFATTYFPTLSKYFLQLANYLSKHHLLILFILTEFVLSGIAVGFSGFSVLIGFPALIFLWGISFFVLISYFQYKPLSNLEKMLFYGIILSTFISSLFFPLCGDDCGDFSIIGYYLFFKLAFNSGFYAPWDTDTAYIISGTFYVISMFSQYIFINIREKFGSSNQDSDNSLHYK